MKCFFFFKMIAIFIFLIFVIDFHAITQAKTSHILVLNQEKDRYGIGRFLEMLEDKDREYTIEQVSSPSFSDLFKPLKSDTLNLGLTDSAVWIRFTLKEEAPAREQGMNRTEWIFDTGKVTGFDYVDFFIPNPAAGNRSHKKWIVERAGRLRTEGENRFAFRPIVFSIPRFLQDPQTFYLRVESTGTMWLNPMIYAKEAYLKVAKKENMLMGIYYGIILVLIFFNLYLFFLLKDRTYLYYTVYVSFVGLWFLFDHGIVVSYFLPGLGPFNSKLTLTNFWFLLFSALLFVQSFLMTKRYAPFIHKLFILIMITFVILMAVTPFADFLLMNKFASALSVITIIMIIISGVVCLSKGFQPARFFIIAWTILLTGGLIKVLSFTGLIAITGLTFHSFQIASGLEVVLIGFSILDRIRILRRERKSIMDVFGKYISNEVRDEILSGRIPLDGESKEVTVLFADLRDFTTIAETSPPKEVVRIINDYFTEMAEAVRHHNGLVLQFIGDEIEAVFGAPAALPDHPKRAVSAALEMRERLKSVNDTLQKRGYGVLKHGIGIHTGDVVAANIGSPDRMSYALVGDTVNVASRIQELNKTFKTDILVSGKTRAYLDSNIRVETLPKRTVKGKKKPVEIFRLI